MKKIVDIELLDSFKMICVFENGERKILDLTKTLDKSHRYAEKVFSEEIFRKTKIGSMGQIYWEGIAEIVNLDGHSVPCEYDMSPEFVYLNSSKISL